MEVGLVEFWTSSTRGTSADELKKEAASKETNTSKGYQPATSYEAADYCFKSPEKAFR